MSDTKPEYISFERLEAAARMIAGTIDQAINPHCFGPEAQDASERRFGFALMLFEFGPQGAPMTYISNADRETMILVLQEIIDRAKAGKPT